ncbi:helix-turn-helix domain-containing protein [Flavisericum labens]|uniref:helix-turn-helix domain-containing protein n=1 Tax=Flavisericum labens TaxID=3377112 RepID=UPI00387B9CF0
MHIKFNYPHKVRKDFLHDVVKQLINQRHLLGVTQDELNHALGVADRLVSHWECGVRSPTAFHLYCWADALNSKLVIVPDKVETQKLVKSVQKELANDNSSVCKTPVNDNMLAVSEKKIKLSN